MKARSRSARSSSTERAPDGASVSACDCLANLAAGAADGVVAARLHVAAFTALATDDESSLEVKASAARALANALRPLEDVEDEAVNPSLSACALELLASGDHREAGASLARALVLATELDEGTVKKLSAALVEAIDSDGAIGALANLLARGATAAPSVLSGARRYAVPGVHRLHRKLRVEGRRRRCGLRRRAGARGVSRK